MRHSNLFWLVNRVADWKEKHTQGLVGGFEEFELALRVSLDGLLVGHGETSRADFTVDIGVLVSLDEAEDFVDITAGRRVLGVNSADLAGRVNDDGGTVVVTGVHQAVVSNPDLVGEVRDDGHLNLANTTLLARDLAPSVSGVDGVNGGTDDLDTSFSESIDLFGEGNDFGRADKGESERVEVENNPLTVLGVVGESDLADFVVSENSIELGVEERSGLADLNNLGHCDLRRIGNLGRMRNEM